MCNNETFSFWFFGFVMGRGGKGLVLCRNVSFINLIDFLQTSEYTCEIMHPNSIKLHSLISFFHYLMSDDVEVDAISIFINTQL